MNINIYAIRLFYQKGEFTDKHMKTVFSYKLILNQVFMT